MSTCSPTKHYRCLQRTRSCEILSRDELYEEGNKGEPEAANNGDSIGKRVVVLEDSENWCNFCVHGKNM